MDYSFLEVPLETSERRADERHRTVFQVARMCVEPDTQHLCLIRNLGSGGMMLESFSSIAVGARVRIEPRVFDPVTGVVRWTRGRRIGVAFEQPIELDQYLQSRGTLLPHHQPRGPRITVNLRCRLRIGAVWHLVPLLDLSQGGAKVITDLPVSLGEEVELHLDGFAPIVGQVRWIRGERLGVTFLQPVHLAHLGQWVDQMASGQPAAS
ncbi:PilZ domain-containing protein [Sphingomonas sp. R647]|uniref:PilZ domain-containing protein n=1 Tax=Sphingomonas sp. R647 TaxID=2875233 RepID=UPI001CD6B330|nr:PilZ domain-containing protein [Sphingomonas sp. R647]MCA1196367.1 PilZ domain-containing protein [Sphingomonas sp. R647]